MHILSHLKTICRHKILVFYSCCECGIPWQGFIHDLSKFSLIEFLPSARYFQGSKSPIEAEKAAIGYSPAWLHHKGHNPHHWEYWIDYGSNGEIIANKIPYKYVIEMICDWIGAGRVYQAGEWTQKDPLIYYNKVRAGRYFHPDTEWLIKKFLFLIAERGLNCFYYLAKHKRFKEIYVKGDLNGK